MSVSFGVSVKGCKTALYRNYEYVKVRDNKNGGVYWRCKMYQKYKCKAHLTTMGDSIINGQDREHTHQSNISISRARLAVSKMKEKMSETFDTPAAVIGSISCALDDQVLQALPTPKALARCLQRHRAKQLAGGDESVLPPPPSDPNFTIPQRFADMVLYDSSTEGERLLMLGNPDLLKGLEQAHLWLSDGTLKLDPSLLFQIYTIHFELIPGTYPVGIYCLIQSKSRNNYKVICNGIKTLIPAASPKRILTDFDMAAMNEFQIAFPKSAVSGSYFHLCQNVLNKVNQIGMKPSYESDSDIQTAVLSIPALALVPEGDVAEAFEILCDEIMELHEYMPELLSYFEHTYIRGRKRIGKSGEYGPSIFSIKCWNQHNAAADGSSSTTTSIQVLNHSLQSLFHRHRPNLWTLFYSILKDMNKNKLNYLTSFSSIVTPFQKKYEDLNDNIVHVVNSYSFDNVLEFLRRIANLST